MDFWRPGNIEYFREVGALRSSHIGEFWNTTLRAKARGFNPSNVFVTKSQLFVLKHEVLSVYQSLASFLSVFSQKQKVALWNCFSYVFCRGQHLV